MSKTLTFVICGCGNRGLENYAAYQKEYPERMKIVAGADSRPERLEILRREYGVPENMCFASAEELLEQPRLADVAIITTQDRQHVPMALKALDKGYHLMVEKPISPSLADCRQLQEKAHEARRAVVVCHVLRYTMFYSSLEKLLRQGSIGKIETIDAVENVGYWHYAHSYVRGNWRRSEESSPMILAKSCHDMDILRWLAGEKCVRVQSFGALDYFHAGNAPEGAALRCLDGCPYRGECPYDAEKIYITSPKTGIRRGKAGWPCTVVASEPTEENLYAALRTGPYGRCVFHSDNDVVDHQTVNLEFENNVYATFTMTAFTEQTYRTIRVTGTKGEIEGDINKRQLTVRRFGQPEEIVDLSGSANNLAGHGGGDGGLMDHMYELISGGGIEGLTSVDASVESHVMALAAEASRLEGGRTIELASFR